jgi:hypothetical protein
VTWLLRAGAVLAVVAAVAVGWALTRGAEESTAPPQPIQVRTGLSPQTHLFGDPVNADIEVTINRRAVDPASVRIRSAFTPYTVVDLNESKRRAGDAVTIQRHIRLLCLSRDCVSDTARLPEPEQIPDAHVTFRPRGAVRDASRPIAWPTTEVASRLGSVDIVGATRSQVTPFRASLTPPAASYRVDPTLATAAAFALALLLAAAGIALLWPELRRLLRVTPRRKDPLAGLPPLERALALLEIALESGGPDEQRKALDRLARELRRRGNDDLAGAARRLAWSPSRPDQEELGAFAGRVSAAVGAAA